MMKVALYLAIFIGFLRKVARKLMTPPRKTRKVSTATPYEKTYRYFIVMVVAGDREYDINDGWTFMLTRKEAAKVDDYLARGLGDVTTMDRKSHVVLREYFPEGYHPVYELMKPMDPLSEEMLSTELSTIVSCVEQYISDMR